METQDVAARIFDNLDGILADEAEEQAAPGAGAEAEGAEDRTEADDAFDAEAAAALRGESTADEQDPPPASDDQGSDDEESGGEPEEDDAAAEDEADEGEPEEDADEAEAGEDPDMFTVRVDGEDVEVTLDELLAGYSRTASWTRKSQALSKERKAFEAERETVQAQREDYGSKLHALEQHFAQSLPKEPGEDASDAEWIRYQRQMKQLEAVRAEKQRVYEEWKAENDRKMEEVVEHETTQLLEAVPEWKDDVVRADGLRSLFKFATGVMGFDEETVRDVRDHRLILLLKMAAEAHELKEAKESVRTKTKKAKTLKPGARPSAKAKARAKKKAARKKGREALRKSGSRDDAARAFEQSGLLDDLI